MRIAFLSDINPQNPYHWSGTTRFVYATLSKYHQVTWIGQDLAKGARWHHRFLNNPNPFYPELYQEQIGILNSKEIKENEYDVIVTSTYYFVPQLKVDIPIVYLGDVTFPQFKKIFTNQDSKYHSLVVATERCCLKSADIILYPSLWAKESAVQEYRIDAEKIHIVEFGANLDYSPKWNQNNNNECHLVFIGKNWQNKGGDIALETYQILQRRGLQSRLSIIGCKPPNPIEDKEITVYPWIDKNTEKGFSQFDSIMRSASFLILPTRFEAFGIAIAEASAYGVPSIVTNVGGTAQVIKEERNGCLLPLEAKAEEYAEQIMKCFTNNETYQKMRLTARQEFESRLNWDAWGRRITAILTQLISKPREKEKQQELYLPTFLLLSPEQKEQNSLLSEFLDKPEFEVNVITMTSNKNKQVCHWEGIKRAILLAKKNQDDVILIIKDTHRFTSSYNKKAFLGALIAAASEGVELLWEGSLCESTPIEEDILGIEKISNSQFLVVFSSLFDKILTYDFQSNELVGKVLTKLTLNKRVILPSAKQ